MHRNGIKSIRFNKNLSTLNEDVHLHILNTVVIEGISCKTNESTCNIGIIKTSILTMEWI